MKNSIKSYSRYEIIKELASGGMGTVFKAKLKGVEGFEKVVAIKTLRAQYARDREFVRKFVFEAKLVANLVHENIVQIYQLDLVDGEYFFVQEFVDGISLHELVEFHQLIKQQFPVELAVFIASRAARGLAYAHNRKSVDGEPLNIIHCDICPHNLLINREGVLKITDFGIAKAATMQDSGKVSGKLAFMSPEQCVSPLSMTGQSDIYSLGVVLFYMLSSSCTRNIHVQRDELLMQIRSNYINWSALPESVPDELRRILQKMLSADPDERYGNSADLARELEYYIYKDGYGPTIVTLADYMRKLLPGRFSDNGSGWREEDATAVLPADYFDRTVPMGKL